jgi:membrane protein DedA with SNARE-associated domain
VAGFAAVLLAPLLYEHHLAVLVLLRPTKEVFLLVGFMIEQGDLDPLTVGLAALPILVGGVWVFYGIGRAYAEDIARASLPGFLGRLLPAKRIRTATDLVERGGSRLVLLARLAALPSSVVAAAAGAGDLDRRAFFLADGTGALLSMAAAVGAGYLLEEAYDEAGPWFTGAGVVALAAMAILLRRRLLAGR